MKKAIILAIALIGLQAIAQGERKERPNRGERSEKMMDLTPDEMATLQTKKMTLVLDLNESQQKDIYKINFENATQRKAMMEAHKAKPQKKSKWMQRLEDAQKMREQQVKQQSAPKNRQGRRNK